VFKVLKVSHGLDDTSEKREEGCSSVGWTGEEHILGYRRGMICTFSQNTVRMFEVG
jgi:hypothetical protein